MAAEATGEDKAWAVSQYRQEFGEDPYTGAGPRRDQFVPSQNPALDPMDAAIKRRAAQQSQAAQGPGLGESAALGMGQGVVGMGDEMAGSSAAYGVGGFGLPGMSLGNVRSAAIERELGGDPTGTKTYEGVRNETRGRTAQAAEDHPGAYYPAMVGTALALPGPTAAKGAGFGTRLATSVAGGAATSGVAGIGQSDAEDPMEMVKDAGTSALVGGTIAGLGTTVAAPFKWAYDKLGKSAPTRIANEAAEGATQQTTATARKHLANAKEGLAKEVIEGPRGDEVRAALRGPAADAPAKLRPRLDELGGQREEAYAAFEQAGKGNLDPAAYRAGLEAAAKAERKPSKRKSLQKMVEMYDDWAGDLTADGAPLSLRDVRDFTTDIQSLSASAIGSYNEHASARLKDQMAAVATRTMDEMLDAAAAGDKSLEAAAKSLRESNKGMSPLLTAQKALKQRANKEASEGSGFRRMGKQAPIPIISGALGAATSEDGDRLENMAMYGAGGLALQKGLPMLGGLMDRGITAAAIGAARHPNSPLPEMAGRAVKPFVPPLSLSLYQALMNRRRQQENQ